MRKLRNYQHLNKLNVNNIVSGNNIYLSCLFPEDEVEERRVPRHVIMHIKSGRMSIDDHERHIVVNAGQTVFVRRDHQVRVHKTSCDGLPYSAVSIVFDRNFLKDYFGANLRQMKFSESYPVLESSAIILLDESQVKITLIDLQRYIKADVLPDVEESNELKTRVLESLLGENPDLYPVLFDFNEPRKIDILEFMERNFKSYLTLEELASYTEPIVELVQRFAKEKGCSPGQISLAWVLMGAPYIVPIPGMRRSERIKAVKPDSRRIQNSHSISRCGCFDFFRHLFQIFIIESRDSVEGYYVELVVEVAVACTLHSQHLFVVAFQQSESIFAEIVGVSGVAMYNQNGILKLPGILKEFEIDER